MQELTCSTVVLNVTKNGIAIASKGCQTLIYSQELVGLLSYDHGKEGTNA